MFALTKNVHTKLLMMIQILFNLKFSITFLSEFNMKKSSSSEDIKMKIVYFDDAALRKQIPWIALENFLNELTSSYSDLGQNNTRESRT